MPPEASPETTCCRNSVTRGASVAQVALAHRRVLAQLVGGPGDDHPAGLEEVRASGVPEGEHRVLLDDEDRRPVLVHPPERGEDLTHYERGETEGRLVEEEQPRARDERTAEREHLLLAARQ